MTDAPLIDWDDNDPPPLPPRVEHEIRPPAANLRPLVGAVAIALAAVVVIGWLADLALRQPAIQRESKPDGGRQTQTSIAPPAPQADLDRRFDSAVADLPREHLNASEEKKALIKSVRPELVPPEIYGSPAPPSAARIAPDQPEEFPRGSPAITREASRPSEPSEDEVSPGQTGGPDGTRFDPDNNKSEKAGTSRSQQEAEKGGSGHARSNGSVTRFRHAVRPDHRKDERGSVRAARQAQLPYSVGRARASIAPVSTAAAPFSPYVLPPALRPTLPPD